METIALSFDIEDWFCVQNMKGVHPFKTWNSLELRVVESTRYILSQLKNRDIKATFFILGWIAEKVPDLVREIAHAGHEIASHGYSHLPITQMQPNEFERDLDRSLNVLYKITTTQIKGYRAPSFSITEKTLWAFKILKKYHIKYDSSIYPTRHPDYGIPHFKQKIQIIDEIIEFPMTSCSLLGMPLPVSGGGYFRLFPYPLYKHLLKRATANGSPPVAYFHPWEFDSNQPRVKISPFKRFRHYTGLKGNRQKFERFISEFDFSSLDLILDSLINCSQLHQDKNLVKDLLELQY